MDDIHNTKAKHFILDFYNIKNYKILNDLDLCLEMVTTAINVSKCGILNIYTHKFSPQGLSINATLSESHCAIHTWPEKKYCAIDLYGCGETDLEAGVNHFLQTLQPGKKSIIELQRGHEGETDASN